MIDRIANIGKSTEADDEQDSIDWEAEHENKLRAAFEEWRSLNGGVFSAEEAKERKEGLVRKLVGWSGDADEFLTMSNAAHEDARIWQLDEEEAAPLANILVRRAMKDETTAVVVRAVMDGDDYVRAAVILLPRLYRTSVWYPRHGGFNLEQWQGPR